MGISRKNALKDLNGLAPRVEKHLAKLAANPGSNAASHWRHEIVTWLTQMEALVTHVGKKTGKEWAKQIAAWRARLGN
jgi:hypothetical protein